MKQSKTACNEGQLAPGNPFPERETNTVGKVIAQPRANRIGERSGDRYAEEGLGWQPDVSAPFYGGVDASDRGTNHFAFEAKIAGQAYGRSVIGAGELKPSWDAVPQESLDGFAAGSSGDPGQAHPYPHQRRPGANPRTLSPVTGLNFGERQNTTIVHQVAPVNGGRGRRNIADVSDL